MRKIYLRIALIAFGACTVGQAFAQTEEQRLVSLAQKLKPISDSAWNEIAGSHSSETYDLQKGDTLWDVSKRLFGNAYYWPKVWSLNGDIKNPHVVNPGQKLAFMPGSSESTPRLAPDTGKKTTVSSPESAEKSDDEEEDGPPEYTKVDPNKWKPVDIKSGLLKQYDPQGFDKDFKIDIKKRFVFRVPTIANDATVPSLGEVVGSRREGVGLSQYETIFLKSPTQDLQVGTTYSILSDPAFVRERKSDRSGYVYTAKGDVKIVGVKDELYIGVISNSTDVITRGDRVYPLLPLITDIRPIASGAALEALVVNTGGSINSSQYQFVQLDRGIEDGVQVGNVFRIYDYYDPETKAKLTDSDFLIHADAIVVHATAQFSTALVINSRSTFGRGDFGVLLTDVSEFEKKDIDRSRALGEPDGSTSSEDRELDELDELDRSTGEGLGRQEENEIKELDQWDKTKDMQNAPAEEPTIDAPANEPSDGSEQNPAVEPAPPQDEPTLDEALDAPTTTPPALDPPPPPADMAPTQEQTLDAPAPIEPSGELIPQSDLDAPPPATPPAPPSTTDPTLPEDPLPPAE